MTKDVGLAYAGPFLQSTIPEEDLILVIDGTDAKGNLLEESEFGVVQPISLHGYSQ